MKKIAIPVTGNVLSAHFGHCEQFYIYSVENDQITNEENLTPPGHQPGVYPAWLQEQGVTDVLAGGIGQRAIDIFKQNNINVFVGAPQDAPKNIAEQFINGSLELTGNFCDH